LIRVRLPGETAARVNDRLTIRLDLARAVWFDPHSGSLRS
jgi:hypothetical protein